MSDRIPDETLRYARVAMRFKLLALMNEAMTVSGATAQRTASRLGCPERHVRRVLAGKVHELSLREIGEIFWAIDGSQISVDVKTRGPE